MLVEQGGTVDAGRLGELVGHLALEEAWDVDEALKTVLDLDWLVEPLYRHPVPRQ